MHLGRPNYVLLTQTVTVYNTVAQNGKLCVHKTVIPNAFMELGRSWKQAVTNIAANELLVLLPPESEGRRYVGAAEYAALSDTDGYYTLARGDKVLYGEGPDITTPAEWGAFVPSYVDGLGVVGYAKAQFDASGQLCHVEGGAL